jgi:hypothetical protein
MRGLEGHYHIIKTQEESNILVSAIHNR